MAVLFPRTTLLPEDQTRVATSAPLEVRRDDGNNYPGSRVHRRRHLLEVLRIVDVKDSMAPVRLRVREWIDERHYRDVDVSGNPVPDFVPEWLAA